MLNYIKLPESLVRKLTTEAQEKFHTRIPIVSNKFSLDEDGKLRSKRRMAINGPGKILERVHRELAIDLPLALHHERRLAPTRASYLFYEIGDHLLIHHDIPQCEVVALVTLEGDDPLVIYPYLGECSPDDVIAFNEAPIESKTIFEDHLAKNFGNRIISESANLIRSTALYFYSRDLPHARFPQKKPAVICALCYEIV